MIRSNFKKIAVRILMTLLGVAFILYGSASIGLGVIGEKGTAVITHIRREGGERNEAKGGRYTYNISYTFQSGGKSVNGFTKRIDNAIYLKADGKSKTSVRYFSFFPYINALETDTKPGFGQLAIVLAGCLMIFVVNRRN